MSLPNPSQPYDPHGNKPRQHYDAAANSVSHADLSAAVESLQEQIDTVVNQVFALSQRLVTLEANSNKTQ